MVLVPAQSLGYTRHKPGKPGLNLWGVPVSLGGPVVTFCDHILRGLARGVS